MIRTKSIARGAYEVAGLMRKRNILLAITEYFFDGHWLRDEFDDIVTVEQLPKSETTQLAFRDGSRLLISPPEEIEVVDRVDDDGLYREFHEVWEDEGRPGVLNWFESGIDAYGDVSTYDDDDLLESARGWAENCGRATVPEWIEILHVVHDEARKREEQHNE